MHSKKGRKNDSCKHCGYSHRSEDCQFSHLTCDICNRKGHLKKVCRFNKQTSDRNQEKFDKPSTSSDRFASKSEYRKKYGKFARNKKSSKVANAVIEESNSDVSNDDRLLSVSENVSAVDNDGNNSLNESTNVCSVKTMINLEMNGLN